jgi:hypothetical protein
MSHRYMECGDLKLIARVENLWMNSLEALCACWKRVITLGMARGLVCELNRKQIKLAAMHDG